MTSIRTSKRVADAAVRRRARRAVLSIAAIVAAAALTACNTSDLLDVETPAAVPVGLIEDPKNAALMVSSAVADF